MMSIVAGNRSRFCCRMPAVVGMRVVQRQV
jgi:hypothetical protein